MSTIADRLSQRTADLSYIPTNAKTALALPTTYYNGSVLRAAGTTTASFSDRLADRKAKATANAVSVQSTIAGRKAAKTAADNLAAAQKRAADAEAQIAGLKDSFSITTPTKANIGLTTIGSTTRNVKPGKRTVGYADDYRGTAGNGKTGGSFAGTGGTRTSIKVTGSKNNSGAAGALGGSGLTGQFGYAYNSSLGSGRNQALKTAVSYLGTRYVLGGTGKTGIDCSGLVMAVYRQLGFKVPTHSAADQGQTGGRHNGNGMPGVRTSISNLRPGDLVAWKDGSHIAIYAGNGKIIEAANPTRGTIYRTLWAPESAVIGIKLTLPGDGNVGAPSKAATRAKSQTLAKKAARFG